jgi:TonB family protein
MQAIKHTDRKSFQALVKNADVDETDDQGWTALMLAAYFGEPSFVKEMIKKNASVNARNKTGLTALFLATRCLISDHNEDVEIARLLIERRADVNAKSSAGVSPLMNAAQRGRLKLVKLLVEKGAKVNDEDDQHRTALTYAMRSKGKDAKEAIQYLQSAGATGPIPEPDLLPSVPILVDQRPVPLNNPTPQYTERARQNHVEGIIIARVLVIEDGSVQQVRITKGLPDGLDEQAIRAAYALRFRPALKNGQPVKFWQAVQIEFRLRRD